MKTIEYQQKLDAMGLQCPLPLLKLKQSLTTILSGQIIQVITTDPGSIRDFQVFCQQAGHQLLDCKEEQDKFLFWIRKA